MYLYSHSAPLPVPFLFSSHNNLSVPCTLALIYSRSTFRDSSGTSSCRLFPTSCDILLHLKIHTSAIYASKKPRSDHLSPCTRLFRRRVELENSKRCH